MLPTISWARGFGRASMSAGRGARALRQTLRRCLWVGAASGVLLCHPRAGSAAPAAATTAAAREFAVRGVITRVEPEHTRVIIAHEAIPDFMEAMTMPFRVKAASALAGVAAGDSVSFRLFVTEEESWIDHIVKIPGPVPKPAPTNHEPAQPAVASAAPPASRHPLLSYAFTNELGQAVRLAEFRGQVLALTFFFSRCPIPDYCPRLARNFAEAARKLRNLPGGPTNYHFLSVTFDPEYDTSARLRAYAQRFGYDTNHWSFLTGPAEKVAELARLSDMRFERDGAFFNHDLRTLIIDPAGHLRMMFPVGGDLSEAIVEEILKAAGATNPPSPSRPVMARDEAAAHGR